MTAPTPTSAVFVPVPGRWIAMAVLLIASFMNLIDVTIVNVALPSMQTAFNATSSQIEWVVAAYILVFALCLLPAGRLGDIFGRRAMFIAGVTVFTIGSALCGFAPSIEMLVAARVVQAVGAAMMTPQTLAIVPALFAPQERGAAFALVGLTSGLAAVAGPMFQTVLANVSGRDTGSAAGTLQSIQQVGAALGVAIVGEVFFSSLMGAGVDHAAYAGALRMAVLCTAASFGSIAALVWLLPKPAAMPQRPVAMAD